MSMSEGPEHELLREAIDSHAPNRLNPIVAMRIIETLGGEP